MRHQELALAGLSCLGALWLACTAPAPVAKPAVPAPAASPPSAEAIAPEPLATSSGEAHAATEHEPPPPPPTQLDPDGNGTPDPAGEGELEMGGHFERLGRHWGALQRICDMQPHGDSLLLAHATRPLGWDGATLTRYLKSPSNPKRPFELVFDWNRPGEPSKGGGAGQGFLRIRSLDGRLYVPDADPPYLGLRLRGGIEGYLFESDREGKFARARHPRKLPPGEPKNGNPGAAVLPRAYHSFDVIRYRGLFYVSIGAASLDGEARGALLVSRDGVEFDYAGADYPGVTEGGVWRLTYMVRFKDRLYTGLESLGVFDPHDYLVWELPQNEAMLSRAHARAARASPTGGGSTLRWYTDRGKLYWISEGAQGTVLRVTSDGDTWTVIDLPQAAGAPSDLIRYKDSLVVLTEHALLSLDSSGVERIAPAPDPSPFRHDDHYCRAPLAVFDGRLYAGGQKKGYLYRLEPD